MDLPAGPPARRRRGGEPRTRSPTPAPEDGAAEPPGAGPVDPLGMAGRGGGVRRRRAVVGAHGRAPPRRRRPVRRDPRGDGRAPRGAPRRPTTRARPAARPTCGRRSARRRPRGIARIAVVCGAWHAPALAVDGVAAGRGRRGAAQGAAEGEGRGHLGPLDPRPALAPRAATARGSSRPAGIDHLWTAPDQVVERWLTRVARLLREEDLDASSASRHRGRPPGRGAGGAAGPAAAGPARAERGDRGRSSASATTRRCG